MSDTRHPGRSELKDGATVAVIGGGPAGAFFAIHLLRKAREAGRTLKVVIFERHRSVGLPLARCGAEGWKGCNYCAGGISPKLHDVLEELGLRLPEEIIQCRIDSISIQGFWKNIELEVPAGRKMLSVYRGSRPHARFEGYKNFDSFLLDEALQAGAGLISGEVIDVAYAQNGKPVIRYRLAGTELQLEADLAVFAAGVNEEVGVPLSRSRMLQSLRRMLPRFRPPRVRQALIFELEVKPRVPANLLGTVHFVEYGSQALPLEMCSLVPKRGFITVVLVGAGVDAGGDLGESLRIAKRFLELPHIRKLVSPGVQINTACVCRPNMVIGSAEHPYGHRIAAVGDMVTARLYKDGILSACQTSRALAETVIRLGVDARSLAEGYVPTLRRFRWGNRLAAFVFLLHRLFFSSSVLSRILYQAVITERKSTPIGRRHLGQILWRIASGDDDYQAIFLSMMHPATFWSILTGGALLTLRNYLTELAFGLRWEGFGRFTTGVAIERLEEKRREFSRLIADASVTVPGQLEFERMYTIKIAAPRDRILEQLGRFGETERGYLKPKWVKIHRVAGVPNTPGCVIQYEIVCPWFSFRLILDQLIGGHLAVYRVSDGFARGGVLLFEIETISDEVCALSIYVAFNFARGRSWVTRPCWWLFRRLFPAFVHDVLWNHSLCQLKDIVEALRRTDGALISRPPAQHDEHGSSWRSIR
jgi:flavin-dependent dehydrogenase